MLTVRVFRVLLLSLAVVGISSSSDSPVASPTYSEAPYSEAPYSGASEAPYSEAPYSEAPYSEAPYDVGFCRDTNEDVRTKLFYVFGEENCSSTSIDEIQCFVEVPGFSASAKYKWEVRSTLVPIYLEVISTYEEGSSGMETSIFQESCLDDFNPYWYSIKQNVVDAKNSCRNHSGEFSFTKENGKKASFTCQRVGELRLKKAKQLCAKFEKVAEFCPGICRTREICKCEDIPFAFPLSRSKTLTCDDLTEMTNKKRIKKCTRKNIGKQCPSVCGNCSPTR